MAARQDAWHTLGIPVPAGLGASDALEYGLLSGWNVRKVPLVAEVSETMRLEVPGRFAVVRTNPVIDRVDVLGQVGSVARVTQNEEHLPFLEALAAESGATFEVAGELRGGARTFVTLRLPGHISVGGVDRIETYLTAVASHDGSSPFTMMTTPVRVSNSTLLNVGGSVVRYAGKRNSGALGASDAAAALEHSFDYLDDFKETADRLIGTSVRQVEFERVLVREFGASKTAAPATVTRCEAKVEAMAKLFADAFDTPGIRETAWAGLSAIAEWSDHLSPTRGEARDRARATAAIFETGVKDRALKLMLQQSKKR